jgi:hypothetical protein
MTFADWKTLAEHNFSGLSELCGGDTCSIENLYLAQDAPFLSTNLTQILTDDVLISPGYNRETHTISADGFNSIFGPNNPLTCASGYSGTGPTLTCTDGSIQIDEPTVPLQPCSPTTPVMVNQSPPAQGGSGSSPPPPPSLSTSGGEASSGMTIQVSNEYAAGLHDTAFDDCYLTAEEMATSEAAMAFAEAFRQTTATSLGVAPDGIVVNGMSTVGRDGPGCVFPSEWVIDSDINDANTSNVTAIAGNPFTFNSCGEPPSGPGCAYPLVYSQDGVECTLVQPSDTVPIGDFGTDWYYCKPPDGVSSCAAINR